jgi:hypothetical protein
MNLGSESKRTQRQGECRTTEDVGRLFERYRVEARLMHDVTGEPRPKAVPRHAEPVEPLAMSH